TDRSGCRRRRGLSERSPCFGSEALMNPAGMKQTCAAPEHLLRADTPDEQRMRAHGLEIEDLNLPCARGDGWHRQRESLRAPHFKRQRLEVDVLLAMMRPEPMRDRGGIARNIGDHQPARILDRRHRWTGVTQRER